MIRLVIPGLCIPKGRPRYSKFGGVYTPKRTQDYENHVRRCWDAEHGNLVPSDKPVRVAMTFLFAPPKSASKKVKNAMTQGDTPCMNPSDLDNLIKSVLDSLNGRCYQDDRQVTEIRASKEWAEVACCLVEVSEVE